MIAEDQRVLSTHPLNAEPAPAALVSSFLTKNADVYHRNHGDFLQFDPKTYSLSLHSEVAAVQPRQSALSLDDVKKFPKRDLVTVLSCAGNRRTEMDHEKEVEGLKWGNSAIANCHFAGAYTSHPTGVQLANPCTSTPSFRCFALGCPRQCGNHRGEYAERARPAYPLRDDPKLRRRQLLRGIASAAHGSVSLRYPGPASASYRIDPEDLPSRTGTRRGRLSSRTR